MRTLYKHRKPAGVLKPFFHSLSSCFVQVFLVVGGFPFTATTELLKEGASYWVFADLIPQTIFELGSVSIDNGILVSGIDLLNA